MNSILAKIVSAFDSNAVKERAWALASSVGSRLSKNVADKTCYEILSAFAGKNTATAVRITFPYFAKVNEIAQDVLNGDLDFVQERFQKSQKKLMKSVTVILNSSPKDLAIIYIGNKMKKGSLKSICAALDRLMEANVGQALFVAAAPVVAPSVLPIALTGAAACQLAAAALAPNAFGASDETQGVELDDFKELDDWIKVEEPDVEAEVLVLDE